MFRVREAVVPVGTTPGPVGLACLVERLLSMESGSYHLLELYHTLTCPFIAILGVSGVFVVRGYYYGHGPRLGLSNSISGTTTRAS
jgi:hypothetical protein